MPKDRYRREIKFITRYFEDYYWRIFDKVYAIVSQSHFKETWTKDDEGEKFIN